MTEITINSVSLNLDVEWELREDTESIKSWYNKSGDKLSLNVFSLKPDLPEAISDVDSLRNLYREMITQANGAIVEVDKVYFGSLLTIKTIFKFAQNPTGFAFLGSYTIPREDCSVVLKIQCHEHGLTGMRESVILDKAIGDGLVDLETKKGWFSDPYDPEFTASLLSNMADREEHDERFPTHPLSRVRSTLKMLIENVEFSDEIHDSPKFFSNFE